MAKRSAKKIKSAEAERLLTAFGTKFPEVRQDFPWGHLALKVAGKAFVFMSDDVETFSASMKLPISAKTARKLPFVKPTGYGLGKHGWVTATFDRNAGIPVDLLCAWIEESYRAIAPKRLVSGLKPAAAAK